MSTTSYTYNLNSTRLNVCEDNSELTTYGITCTQGSDIVTVIADICTDKKALLELIKLMNEQNINPKYVLKLVEDNLNSLMSPDRK